MPHYDYECSQCKHEVELFHKMSDPPIVTCPKCGQNELKRLFSGGMGIIFKGAGWTPRHHFSGIQKDLNGVS